MILLQSGMIQALHDLPCPSALQVRGGGSFWPVRDYAWGTCEAFSTQHSDCTYLKRLILEVR
eukprot:782-Eustigmatos_ZCMA.PRE.1